MNTLELTECEKEVIEEITRNIENKVLKFRILEETVLQIDTQRLQCYFRGHDYPTFNIALSYEFNNNGYYLNIKL